MDLNELSQKLEDHLTDQDIQDAQELLDDTYQEIVDMRGELVEAQAEIIRLKAAQQTPTVIAYGHGLIGTANYGWDDGSCAIGLKFLSSPVDVGSVICDPSPKLETNDLIIRADNQAGLDVFAEYFDSCREYMKSKTEGKQA